MDPFVGQLLLVAFNFAPTGFALCQGQLLPISQNTALFSLLGTNYGGDGRSTFGLPNLQGVMVVGQGTAPSLGPFVIGQTGGEASVTLLANQLPAHTHTQTGLSGGASSDSPSGTVFAAAGGRFPTPYFVAPPAGATLAPMNPSAIQVTGGSQPHSNLMPYLVLNWIIALTGVFPSRP